MKHKWLPPSDLDPECLELCVAMNKMPGIETTCSCCGHGKHEYWIFFQPKSLAVLPPLLYWFDHCHSGRADWEVIVYTDCASNGPFFMVKGPTGQQAYDDAKHIAKLIEQEIREHR